MDGPSGKDHRLQYSKSLDFSPLFKPGLGDMRDKLGSALISLQVIFLMELLFSPQLKIGSAWNEWNNLEVPQNPNKERKINLYTFL